MKSFCGESFFTSIFEKQIPTLRQPKMRLQTAKVLADDIVQRMLMVAAAAASSRIP